MKKCKTISCLLLFFTLFTALFFLAPESHAASITVKGKLTARTSYKIKLKDSKGITHWRIRRAKVTSKGAGKYKTIKTLKKSKKTYTVKKLAKNTRYSFMIVGLKKTNGKLKALTCAYCDCYTGMSTVTWDDYAYCDAPCSPTSITLRGYCNSDGLAIKGFMIYRKVEGQKSFTKLKTVGTKAFPYKDTAVQAGKTYVYKFRSYGKYNKKTLYSPWSDTMTRSAVNQTGTFTSNILDQSDGTLTIQLTSAANNGVLVIQSTIVMGLAEQFSDIVSNDEPYGASLIAYSFDNLNWTDVSGNVSLSLNGGKSIYLRYKLKAYSGSLNDLDLSRTSILGTMDIKYNRLPSCFYVKLGGDGSAYMNSEVIH